MAPMRTTLPISTALFSYLFIAGCSSTPTDPKLPATVNAANHRWFPISTGAMHEYGKTMGPDGALTCDGCHRPGAESFTAVRCDQCHKHTEAITQRLHLGIPSSFTVDTSAVSDPDLKAELRGASCFGCHPTGEKRPFSHTLITSECAQCHAVDNAFAALPKAGFTHRDVGAADCAACHVTTAWSTVSAAPSNVSDPAHDLTVTGLLPTFTGTTISRVSALAQTLPMPMNHLATSIDAGVLTDCAACHQEANTGVYFPGLLHSSLANVGQAQPAQCAECHARSVPLGFVGAFATAPARTPATGEMRHDAVAWANGAPGATRIVTQDCATCHHTPSPLLAATWRVVEVDGGPAQFHAALTAAAQAQPTSCLDCHANSRPVAALTSMNAALPAGMTFDHGNGDALQDCVLCHSSTSAWSGGKFHLVGSAAPASCVGCHEAKRPTSTTGWTSTTYQASPFDYGTNAQGITHGGGEDCAVCHGGSTQTWAGGHFPHGVGTLATQSCSACHTSQRPTAPVPGVGNNFNHTLNGTGDCRACHQATVTAGRYVDLNPIPGGDWKGGKEYPGDVVVTSPTQFIALQTWTLQRNAARFVTGMTTQNATLFNAMLHTSTAIPAALFPGPANAPDNSTCFHCHTNVAGTVTSFADGKYHAVLTDAGVPQPTARCLDCHEQMRPDMIVEKSASVLQPMDHSATFTAPVTIAGQTVSGVATLDCSVCHASPGSTWGDGKFHAKISTATPADCVTCHYPLMASPQADVTTGTTFAMKHRSTQVTVQKCETCHTTALSKSAMAFTPSTGAALWKTGTLHPHVAMQPASCVECHALSEPTMATQGTTTWTFTTGGTATNSAQWMSHPMADVAGKDCAACHLADAKPTGSAWNKGTDLHAKVPSPTGCAACHGTSNGRGTVIGTNNNLPSGLTNSQVTTTAGPFPGVKDQLNHADINVTARDCSFCHTQKGTSTVAGVQGQEWRQATFHKNFSAASPLVMNTTTGRCSTCHFNLKPGATFAAFDHATFTSASGTPDCSSCHSWPGTSAMTPNWLGAAAMPAFIAVGGFTISQPPATAANTLQTGIANLPHPAVATGVPCTACHAQAAGGRHALGYDHLSSLASTRCGACHEAGSDLVATPWNGATTEATGAGDTRPFTLPSVRATYKGNTATETYPKHFFPIDCKECHLVPAGNGLTTTGTVYQAAWKFPHTQAKMTNPSTCLTCHPGGVPN